MTAVAQAPSNASSTATPAATLSDGGYEMLRIAVDLARDRGVQTVASLRSRLHDLYPSRKDEVDEGLRFWSANVKQRYPNGVPH